MTSNAQEPRMSGVAFALAAVGLVASILFILMFLFEVPDNGPYHYGAAYEVFAAIDSLLAAALVVHLSGKATRAGALWLFGLVLAVLLVANAVSAVLFLMHGIDPGASNFGGAIVVLLQGVWMFWLNRRLGREGVFPRLLATWGWLIGAGLVIGLVLAGIGLMLPPLSIGELLLLVPGIFIAGGVWLVWPAWYVLLGFRLLRGVKPAKAVRATAAARATLAKRATGRATGGPTGRATDAPTRGRRKA